MHSLRSLPVFCLLMLVLAATPARVAAHIRLESSTPAAGDTINIMPAQLWLGFSAHIEARYTSVRLFAPDGEQVATGEVNFDAGSDRSLTVALPPLRMAGLYTVRWRTAGADGHVLEGSYTFTLAGEAVQAEPVIHPPEHEPEVTHEHGAPMAASPPLEVLGRFLHFAALTLLLGALSLRALLLPRLTLPDGTQRDLERRAWRTLGIAVLLLVAAALFRLWLQSVALHGSARALSSPLLSMMLTDTSWGRAWLLQAFFIALLAAGVSWARPHRDRVALAVAILAGIGLAAIPGMTGHAAGVTGTGYIVLANDTLHVLAAGAWIGSLALLLSVVVPSLTAAKTHTDAPPDGGAHNNAAVHIVARFSPIALTAAAIIAVTGVINAVLHLQSVSELVSTRYGITLLVKIGLVLLVLAAGAYNWQVVQPRLLAEGARALRRSAVLELAFATLVLAATAVLSGTTPP